MAGSVTKDKFFSRDRQRAFDEIKEMMYRRMEECNTNIVKDSYGAWDDAYNSATRSEIRFIRSVIDMMERS